MKLKLNNERIVRSKITTEYDFTIENSKGEEMEIVYQTYTLDSEFEGYDNDQLLLDEDGNEIPTETLEEFLGEDYNEDLISILEESILEKVSGESEPITNKDVIRDTNGDEIEK